MRTSTHGGEHPCKHIDGLYIVGSLIAPVNDSICSKGDVLDVGVSPRHMKRIGIAWTHIKRRLADFEDGTHSFRGDGSHTVLLQRPGLTMRIDDANKLIVQFTISHTQPATGAMPGQQRLPSKNQYLAGMVDYARTKVDQHNPISDKLGRLYDIVKFIQPTLEGLGEASSALNFIILISLI